jgi:uncharacterized Fe-S cluster protein YjdI
MSGKTHQYTNGELTVVWKPDVCIHSTLCWKNLRSVFDPGKRPWINMSGSSTANIIEQVKLCPSGALSYFMNSSTTGTTTEQAAQPQIPDIEILPDGPILIKNRCLLQLSDGSEQITSGTTALCRCGASRNKPYCDGSHKQTGFKG